MHSVGDIFGNQSIKTVEFIYFVTRAGFLSLKDPELGIPGNAGLKDQVMALKWVKENCMHFGGDPNNISKCKNRYNGFVRFSKSFRFVSFQAVFGESAGSASVSMHLLSDQSKNLFHKAIMMSGTAFSPWALSMSGGDFAQRLAKKLGWNGEGGELACLRILQTASKHAIVRAQDRLMSTEEYKQIRFIAFSPVLEPFETDQCFLRKHPSELIASAWSKHVPAIIGVCANEGLLFYKSEYR